MPKLAFYRARVYELAAPPSVGDGIVLRISSDHWLQCGKKHDVIRHLLVHEF